MSRLGIVCGTLVILGLLSEFWLVAKLGKRSNDVAENLRAAKLKSEQALVEFDKAAAELKTAEVSLAAKKLGWGYEFELGPGNPAPVQNQGGKLFVTGLGSSAKALEPRKTTDDAGQEKMVATPMHVFADNGQGKVVYTGEFRLGIGPNELGEQTCVLYPTWNVSPEEMASWNFNNGVRIRTQIPPGGRAEIDSLNQTIQRSNEQMSQLATRIADQQLLKVDADQALLSRRNELLGDAKGADVAERPEFKVGLLRAIEDTEEERNALQVAVDAIRRAIQRAIADRSKLVDSVKKAASDLKPVTNISTATP
ncbi:MAG: hypothetical protein DWI22_08990 [Planctomycetota bacterium]|jgi:hypothetical protein|nr:MAG: hypothetical protein DWI22_08990 [Planctomycetota bacterium]